MESQDFESRLKHILTKRVGIPTEELKLDAKLVEDLGLDSIDLVELTIAAEKEFGIAISDEQVAELVTVASVVDLIKRLAGKV